MGRAGRMSIGLYSTYIGSVMGTDRDIGVSGGVGIGIGMK